MIFNDFKIWLELFQKKVSCWRIVHMLKYNLIINDFEKKNIIRTIVMAWLSVLRGRVSISVVQSANAQVNWDRR